MGTKGTRLLVPLGSGLLIAALATVVLWDTQWNPFLPKDYEACAESAATTAKSKDALAILISSCSAKFVGRRNPRGGYTYHDERQSSEFPIAGPNPTKEEWARIDEQYSTYLDDIAKAAVEQQRAVEQHRREAAQQAAIAQAEQERKRQQVQAILEQRRHAAIPKVAVTSTNVECLYPALDGCSSFHLTPTVKNNSVETISMLSLGWAFLPTSERTCPTAVQTMVHEQVRLRPGDTIVLNIQRFDGPASKQFRFCVKVTDAQIVPSN
jgi:hypothetical protein